VRVGGAVSTQVLSARGGQSDRRKAGVCEGEFDVRRGRCHQANKGLLEGIGQEETNKNGVARKENGGKEGKGEKKWGGESHHSQRLKFWSSGRPQRRRTFVEPIKKT